MDRTIKISDFPEIQLFTEDSNFEVKLDLAEEKEGINTYKFSIKSEEANEPQPITLRWRVPYFNMKGVWKCGGIHDKRQQYDWELEHLKSRISVDAPIISVFGHDDSNGITFACSDAINLLEMNALLREEDCHLYCHITFFSEAHPAIKAYEAEIRVDTRKEISYAQSIQEVAAWWENFEALKPAAVPELARMPLYSTWYQFHQNMDEATLIKECQIAKKMGYELIIIDDGWQTMDTNRGYDYTGDWQPDRFPDMADFVSKLHETSMKVGIWFSVPFCGKKSKAYQKFKGKFLIEDHRWAPVFDPRYPEVRQHLIDIYANAVQNWNLDALKLDFIDDFQVYPETVLTKENGRDYANVNEAVDRLLTDVMQTLKVIKPDIAIEFRQKYIGPTMRKFGNMFRAFDCPNDPVSNRIRITDVKLLCNNSAVHSDPQIWHEEEKVEVAALQVLNGFFGVPQMSIHLRHFPEDHLKMINFYTKYWRENMDLLLDGEFKAANPLGNYPILKSYKNGHAIVGVYDDVVMSINGEQRVDVLNGKPSGSVAIKNTGATRNYEVTTWDCQGNVQLNGNMELPTGITEITVPPSGMISIVNIE
ncbi:MAG: glycoside hydrolase family 36 protein [Bacteroidota bacterium]